MNPKTPEDIPVKASYISSGVRMDQLPAADRPEFALIGRSNVGKSSLINRLAHHQGRISAIHPCPPGEASIDAPLALTPPVEPHAHLDKAYSWPQFPNREGTLEGALEANRREAEQRSGELVLERGERALDRAWRYGLRAVRSHIDSLGPAAEASRRAASTSATGTTRSAPFARAVTIVVDARRASITTAIPPAQAPCGIP